MKYFFIFVLCLAHLKGLSQILVASRNHSIEDSISLTIGIIDTTDQIKRKMSFGLPKKPAHYKIGLGAYKFVNPVPKGMVIVIATETQKRIFQEGETPYFVAFDPKSRIVVFFSPNIKFNRVIDAK